MHWDCVVFSKTAACLSSSELRLATVETPFDLGGPCSGDLAASASWGRALEMSSRRFHWPPFIVQTRFKGAVECFDDTIARGCSC